VITGTDTDVGKTVVTAALAVALAHRGPVAVYKPAQSGVSPDEPGDVDEVARLSGTTAVVEGVRLAEPLAPATAARRHGIELPSVAAHARRTDELAATYAAVLVEGAGGVLVWLDGDENGLIELARGITRSYAFVVVCRSGLGTLNHTALTVGAVRSAGHPILGVIFGSWPAEPDLASRCNAEDLPRITNVPLLGRIPDGAGQLDPSEFRRAASGWFTSPITPVSP
jgi:dethiobiotin synthetase